MVFHKIVIVHFITNRREYANYFKYVGGTILLLKGQWLGYNENRLKVQSSVRKGKIK